MGKLPGLIQKALKLSGGHPDGIIRPPVAPAPAAYGAALQIAALGLRQRCQRLDGLVKLRGLQIDVPGVDDLLVFQNTSAAVPTLVIIAVGVSVEISLLLCPAGLSAGWSLVLESTEAAVLLLAPQAVRLRSMVSARKQTNNLLFIALPPFQRSCRSSTYIDEIPAKKFRRSQHFTDLYFSAACCKMRPIGNMFDL